jgi:DNA topoisomerase-2
MAHQDLNKYQKKSDREHILDNPDTYIGSVELIESNEYIISEDESTIYKKQILYNPGLYKLFDEGIVNCRDHVCRMQQRISESNDESPNIIPVQNIDISINPDDGTITMFNDGNGIDIAQHPEYKLWIPELIFGHLRTSTNYDKTEKRIVGGKNGFGFKLVLIWSTWGRVETVDHTRGLKYCQEFSDNLGTIENPKITKCRTKPYTKIQFRPDYNRLQLAGGLTPDILALLKRRVYDIAAVTDKSVKVKFNGQPIQVKTFQQYVSRVKDTEQTRYESNGDRWEYAVGLSSEGEFCHVSFVNGIYTSKGGRHVEYIVNQIVKRLTKYIETKKKITVKPSSIREQLAVYIRCDIENPSFDSQTKDYMNTPVAKFGSTCEVSDEFIEKIAKMGVMTAACQLTDIKDNQAAKKSDGSKSRSIRGIPKLIDANLAGTAKSGECILILCEGDSAKAGIVSGLSREDRNIVGIYPMKGKLFNVRGETVQKINDNREIAEIKQILGLEHGRKYTPNDVKTRLRYSQVLFMTDQDLDGSHIKGLGINIFDSEWRSLIEIPDFIGYMNTPILKATRGKECVNFYNNGEFEEWKKTNDSMKWTIKYYKGLGTSTGVEFKEYFAEKKVVYFTSTGADSVDMIDMVFNKKRSNDRKKWLAEYSREDFLDTSDRTITYQDFINKDLRHFSKYDNERSIPSLIDGLKISLRKILYSAFKKGIRTEIKVAQFSGYVSEHSGYHHGEASLNGAIVGLAQDYVGSNNINLLQPKGQFGTRLAGGKDSASERYIFTQLSDLTRKIFPESDDKILRYLEDDGDLVEPIFYAPIIPMILVNGSKGIGTGFSTDIMCHNPLQIIEKIEAMLTNNNNNSIKIEPYYRGFKGKIMRLDNNSNNLQESNCCRYLIKGVYEIDTTDKIKITELPVGTWTQDYKELLEGLMNPTSNQKDQKRDPKRDQKKSDKPSQPLIKDYVDMSTDTTVEFIVTLYPGMLEQLMSELYDYNVDGVEKMFRLYTTASTNNMHLFNSQEQLTKYDTVEAIIDEYYTVRLEYYGMRRKYLIERLKQELVELSNLAKYIQYTLDDKIDLRKKSGDAINQMLETMGFDKLSDKSSERMTYNYLIKKPMDIVTDENVAKIMRDRDAKQLELDSLTGKTPEQLWLHELHELKKSYLEYIVTPVNDTSSQPTKSTKGKTKSKK